MASFNMLTRAFVFTRQTHSLTGNIIRNCVVHNNNIPRGFCSSAVLCGTKAVRIGCASGFWGDTATAAPQLIHKGKLDFLVFDYLSEITMSLLSAAKNKNPKMGYAVDFVDVAMKPFLQLIKDNGVRVISNAGGINPQSAADALQKVASAAGIDLKIAVVTGDDLFPKIGDIQGMGVKDIYSGERFPDKMTSMTAYLGAGGICEALDRGADIVITGRCTDSALVLAPLMHTHKWKADDFDLLASGSLAGHLIECGAQATGGIFTDWHLVPDWDNMGFPIVEVESGGEFILTKPPKTGGLVSPATVGEQLVYEIGDPANYILPDVVCDFSQVKIQQVQDDVVKVTGARGKPPTDQYKVSSTYADGYRLTAVCPVGGPKAVAKSRKTAEAIIKRTRNYFKMLKMDDYSKVHIQVLGAEDTYGANATPGDGPREAVVWISAHHSNKLALSFLAREIAPAGTGMAPGLTGIAGGRPKVSPVLKLFSFLFPKDQVQIEVKVNGESLAFNPPQVETQAPSDITESQSSPVDRSSLDKGSLSYRLEDLAYARSGDKGNNCNIGVIARDARFLPYIKAALTPEAVDKYMSHVFDERSGPVSSRVQRYDLPGINGLNFVLHNSLGGGGIASLRSDPQGKAFAQMLLDFQINDLPKLLD